MFLAIKCQHASGACQSHSRLVLSLREASRKYAELSHSTPLFLRLRFHKKDLLLTSRLLQVRLILPPLGHILSRDQLHLLVAILAQWQHPVASCEALDLLHQAMHAVSYRRTATAIKMTNFLCVFVDCCLLACCPDGHRGNTEQVLARWRRPEASSVALDMLHWGMPSVLLWHTAMAIKMASNRGPFVVCHHHLFCLLYL
jgi:hypothetical protein